MKLLKWLWAYALLFAGTVGVAIALSWLLGTDDDVKAWAGAHRPLTLAAVALSIVIFMMYKFLEDIDDQ